MLHAAPWTPRIGVRPRRSPSIVKLTVLFLLLSLAIPFVSRADDPPLLTVPLPGDGAPVSVEAPAPAPAEAPVPADVPAPAETAPDIQAVAPAAVSDVAPGASGIEQALFARINAVRADYGLRAYTLNPALSAVARGHVADMARRRWMSHTGSDGSSYRQRIARAGIRFGSATENIGMGYDLDRMFTWWMNSPVHRAAILGTKYNQVGIAYLNDGRRGGNWWTINFVGP